MMMGQSLMKEITNLLFHGEKWARSDNKKNKFKKSSGKVTRLYTQKKVQLPSQLCIKPQREMSVRISLH